MVEYKVREEGCDEDDHVVITAHSPALAVRKFVLEQYDEDDASVTIIVVGPESVYNFTVDIEVVRDVTVFLNSEEPRS